MRDRMRVVQFFIFISSFSAAVCSAAAGISWLEGRWDMASIMLAPMGASIMLRFFLGRKLK